MGMHVLVHRFIVCVYAAEGVLLLDLSSPGWSVEYANPVCVAAAAVSALLAAGSDQSGGVAPNFWDLFEEVADEGGPQSKVGQGHLTAYELFISVCSF